MRPKAAFCLLFLALIIMLCGCRLDARSPQEEIKVERKGELTPDKLNVAIERYFTSFNHIEGWSRFATDDFVKRVYLWCSGDDSDSKSIDEMKRFLKDLEPRTYDLTGYQVESYNLTGPGAEIFVTREWENDETDRTSYSLVKINNEWKIDDRY
ncbi:hypothetical protein OMP38_02965 [Cohnella ginsengisoli]|uniref:Uncharacterized protein n=1 Tax=Cohnella ginsengisoli TaxID=425004 RepID=A0A9X4KDC3_9BACL|nr:hypothetical protein [Cohnella ginsengisoli]MDG0789923.1 hypothetical protein [Cohnella ginsengisoli]